MMENFSQLDPNSEMSESVENQNSSPTEPEQFVPEDASETSSPTVEPILEALHQEIANLKQQLIEQTEKAENFRNQYLRIAADFENFRKRNLKDKENLELQVKRNTITELLPAIDNFERARVQIKPADEGQMEIHKSYQGVYKILVESLKRIGVSPMRPEGQAFDPIFHEAMLQEPTSEHPEGTIIEQLVRGYLLNDQVLRHAMVKVAAPPEMEPKEELESLDSDLEIN